MITNLMINARNRAICIFAMIAAWSKLHGTLETSFLTENHYGGTQELLSDLTIIVCSNLYS